MIWTVFDFIRARVIKIGNNTNTYLGRPVNVPDDMGIRKERIAKSRYERRIPFFQAK